MVNSMKKADIRVPVTVKVIPNQIGLSNRKNGPMTPVANHAAATVVKKSATDCRWFSLRNSSHVAFTQFIKGSITKQSMLVKSRLNCQFDKFQIHCIIGP